MDDTQTTQTAASPVTFQNGTEVYDSLMAQIDPELLSENISHLDEPYAGETQEQHDARYERYSAAFAKYDEAYAAWEADLNAKVTAYRRTALQTAEAESRAEDVSVLDALEQSITDESSPTSL